MTLTAVCYALVLPCSPTGWNGGWQTRGRSPSDHYLSRRRGSPDHHAQTGSRGLQRRRRDARIVGRRRAADPQAGRHRRGDLRGVAGGRTGGSGRASSTWAAVAVSIRRVTVRTCAAVTAILVSAGCGASPATPAQPGKPVNVKAASMKEGFGTMERLAQAAKQEGTLTVVALPRDWVNYGEIIDTFADTYDIEVKELEPQASSSRSRRRRRSAQAGRVRSDPGRGGVRRGQVRARTRSRAGRTCRTTSRTPPAPGTPPTAATCPSGTTPAPCPRPPPSPISPSPATRSRWTATRCARRRPSRA